jgi:hypothetical protein
MIKQMKKKKKEQEELKKLLNNNLYCSSMIKQPYKSCAALGQKTPHQGIQWPVISGHDKLG